MNTNDIVITLPPSKSLSNRWLIVNYLQGDAFQLKNLSHSSDTRLLKRLLEQLRRGSTLPFSCGNAGSVARFLMALFTITPGTRILTGDDRLRQRPMNDLIEALRGMGFNITCLQSEGFLPVQVDGGVPRRKMAFINPTLSSQFVSALMLIAPELTDGMTISMTDRPSSKPYIEMTRLVLQQAGVQVSVSRNGRIYSIPHRSHTPIMKSVKIENDWSSASYFFLVAALLGGKRLRLKGLSLDSSQGDRVVADYFTHLGVQTREVRSPYHRNSPSVTLVGGGKAEKKVRFNFIDCPDLMPTIAVACAALHVEARLRGVKNLRLKESDRIAALAEELRSMGGRIDVSEDEIHIYPSTLAPSRPVRTYGDHRIAMAFAPLVILFPDLLIENTEVVEKSFPDFWRQLQSCTSNL